MYDQGVGRSAQFRADGFDVRPLAATGFLGRVREQLRAQQIELERLMLSELREVSTIIDTSTLRPAGLRRHDRAHALAHCAEVDGDVGRVGDELAGAIEHRAGKIEPFPDVDRTRRAGKRGAHFLGDGHEQAVENLQPYRIDFSTHGSS